MPHQYDEEMIPVAGPGAAGRGQHEDRLTHPHAAGAQRTSSAVADPWSADEPDEALVHSAPVGSALAHDPHGSAHGVVGDEELEEVDILPGEYHEHSAEQEVAGSNVVAVAVPDRGHEDEEAILAEDEPLPADELGEGEEDEDEDEDEDQGEDEGDGEEAEQPKSALRRYWPLGILGVAALAVGGIKLSGMGDTPVAAPLSEPPPAASPARLAQTNGPPSLPAAGPNRVAPPSPAAPAPAQPAAAPRIPVQQQAPVPPPAVGAPEALAPDAPTIAVPAEPVRLASVLATNSADVPSGAWFARIGELPDLGGMGLDAARTLLDASGPPATPRLLVKSKDSSGADVWRLAFGPFNTVEDAQRACAGVSRECRVIRGLDLARAASPPPAPPPPAPPVAQAAPAVASPPRVTPPPAPASPAASPLAAAPGDLAALSRAAPPVPPVVAQVPRGPAVRMVDAGEQAPPGLYAWFATLPGTSASIEDLRARLGEGDATAPPRLAAAVGRGAGREWRLALGPFRSRPEVDGACKPIVDAGGHCLVTDGPTLSPAAARPRSGTARLSHRASPTSTQAEAAASEPALRNDWRLQGAEPGATEAYVVPSDRAFGQPLVLRVNSRLPDGSRVQAIRQGENGSMEIITDKGTIRRGG